MNNPKILKKVLGAALTLAMIVGAFSMFAVGTSAASAGAFKLLDGVDFDDYTGTTQADAHAYIYEQTGMYFTSQTGTSAATNVDIKDGALYFSSFSYVSGGTGDSKISSDKYAKSSDVLDLFFTANGPKKYTLEFDLVITDKILPTSDNADRPSSPYRGCSMISFGRYNWFVKATSVGVSTYEMVDGVFTPNNDAQADVGYFYADGATIEATETNGVAAATSTVKTGPVTRAMPAGKDKLVAYKIGEPVNIKIEFTKNASNTSAATYVNGTKLSTKTVTYIDESKIHGIRWGDSNYAKFSVDNLKLTVNECNADHSTDWSVISNDGTKVSVGYDSLDIVAPCSCGDLLPVGSVNNALVTADYVYGGNAAIEGLPTAGEFWVATDYNVRTAEALASATNIMKIGNEIIAVDTDNMTAPETYSVALKVTYTAENVADLEVYINGELSDKRTGVALEDATTLYLGDEGATSDIRFFRTKIVELGNEAAVKVTYNNMDDETLRPCMHSSGDSNIITGITRGEDGELSYSYQCDKCGEWVDNLKLKDYYDPDAGITMTDRSFSISGSAKYYNLPEGFDASDAEPYQLEFVLEYAGSAMNDKNIMNFMSYGASGSANGDYDSPLRAYTSSTATIDLKAKNVTSGSNVFLKSFNVGDSAVISLIVHPSTKAVDIYVDGVFIVTHKNCFGQGKQLRFSDYGSGSWNISDFKLIRKAEAEHVHTDKWATPEEKANTTVRVLDNKTLAYEYDCYCGERATTGIKTVLADNIKPQYNLTCSAVAVETPVLDERAIFAGELAVEELPAEGIKALVSLGELAMVSVDADGVVYVGETATETVLADDAQKYTDFAVFFENGIYTVYIDGANIGNGEYDTVAAITVGSEEEMGFVHFDRMVLATVALHENATYGVVAKDHDHIFDLYSSELQFNDKRTSITVEYICTICDRPAFDGIEVNLYDNVGTTDVEVIPAIAHTDENGSVILDGISKYLTVERGEDEEPVVYDSYWFSADFTVERYVAKYIQPVVTFGDKTLVYVDSDGQVRIGDGKYTTVGTVKPSEIFNVTVYVNTADGVSNLVVYVNGVYRFNCSINGDVETIKAGAEASHILSVTNTKLVTIENGGIGQVGAFTCDEHTFDYANAKVSYIIDPAKFEIARRCLVCGITVTDKPVHNNYKGAVTNIYNNGNIGAEPVAPKNSYAASFIVADVNLRSTYIGAFDGYKNLIGYKGKSLVLINSQGKLMLGDGITTNVVLDGMNTYNIAIEIANEKQFAVYVEGEYAGEASIADLKYTYDYTEETEKNEEFGAEGLENVKFYNIKSFYGASEGEEVTFTFSENEAYVPCPHIVGDAELKSITYLGSNLNFYFICSKCGERVHAASLRCFC